MGTYPQISRFIAARDSWYRSRRAAQAKMSGLRSSIDLRRTEQRWQQRGARYLRGRYTGILVPGWAERTGNFEDEVLELIGAIAPEVAAAMDEEIAQRLFEVWKDWPVSSGLSKSLLDAEFRVKGESLVGAMISRAPYTTFIKGRPHQKLMFARAKARGGIDAAIVRRIEARARTLVS